MRILILGGTVFLGRHLVHAAQERGHTLTLFNRGQRNPDLFPELERLTGDRDGGLDILDGREWDAVIDTCGYFPRVVRQSAEKLANSVRRYVFISSISAYAHFREPYTAENAPIATTNEPDATKVTGENYGGLKALCEQAVEENLPGRALIIRPGYIVGRYDPSDRFTHWVFRARTGGDILVPGDANMQVEYIDVRDLAEWTIRLVEQEETGIFNACGPQNPLTLGTLLETCQAVSPLPSRLRYVAPEFMKAQDVSPDSLNIWWIGEEDADFKYISYMDCRKAQASGLTYRSLEDTVRDTMEWDASRPEDLERRFGIPREREEELLRLWDAPSPPSPLPILGEG